MKKLAVILVNVVACVLLIEGFAFVALRVLEGEWTTKGEFYARYRGGVAENDSGEEPSGGVAASLDAPQWILHPYFGFARNPEAVGHKFNDRPLTVEINPFGFFGPSPMVSSNAQRFVVAITGGSVAADLYMEAPGELVAGLGKLPQVEGKEVVLVCLALGGMKQPQQLLALNYFLSLGARYDMVLNVDGFNEVVLPLAENRDVGVNPFFPRNWLAYASMSVNLETATIYGRLSEARAREAAAVAALGGGLLTKTYTGLTLWRLRHAKLQLQLVDLNTRLKELTLEEGLTRQQTGPPYERKAKKRILEDLVGMWSRASQQMWGVSRSEGMEYYHFLQPNQYVADSKPLSDAELQYAYNAFATYSPKAADGYPALIAEGRKLAKRGVPFFDLTQIFAQNRETLYEDACCHLNPLGNQLMAHAIVERVAGASSGR